MAFEPDVDAVTCESPVDGADRLGDLVRATAGDARRARRLAERVLRELRANVFARTCTAAPAPVTCGAAVQMAAARTGRRATAEQTGGEPDMEADWRLAA